MAEYGACCLASLACSMVVVWKLSHMYTGSEKNLLSDSPLPRTNTRLPHKDIEGGRGEGGSRQTTALASSSLHVHVCTALHGHSFVGPV